MRLAPAAAAEGPVPAAAAAASTSTSASAAAAGAPPDNEILWRSPFGNWRPNSQATPVSLAAASSAGGPTPLPPGRGGLPRGGGSVPAPPRPRPAPAASAAQQANEFLHLLSEQIAAPVRTATAGAAAAPGFDPWTRVDDGDDRQHAHDFPEDGQAEVSLGGAAAASAPLSRPFRAGSPHLTARTSDPGEMPTVARSPRSRRRTATEAGFTDHPAGILGDLLAAENGTALDAPRPPSHAELHCLPFVAVCQLLGMTRSNMLVRSDLQRATLGSESLAAKDLAAGLKLNALLSKTTGGLAVVPPSVLATSEPSYWSFQQSLAAGTGLDEFAAALKRAASLFTTAPADPLMTEAAKTLRVESQAACLELEEDITRQQTSSHSLSGAVLGNCRAIVSRNFAFRRDQTAIFLRRDPSAAPLSGRMHHSQGIGCARRRSGTCHTRIY